MNWSAKISPSSASIWGKPDGCRGYGKMMLQVPKAEQNAQASKGTSTHATAGLMLLNRSNGSELSQEMGEACRVYLNDIQNVARNIPASSMVFDVEKTMIAFRIHAGLKGTVDCFLWDSVNRILYVWDFKTGRLIVEVFENWQMISYTAAIFDFLRINGMDDQTITVKMRIVQPRAFHRDGTIREWEIRGSNLRGYFNQLTTGYTESLDPDAKLRSGSHCVNCDARIYCPAASKAGTNLYEVGCEALPVDVSPHQLGAQLAILRRGIEQLKTLEVACTEQIKSIMKSGIQVSGVSRVQGYGNRTWTLSTKELEILGRLLKQKLTQVKSITPTQARDKGVPVEIINQNSHVPAQGFKIVVDDGSEIKRIFGES